MKKKKKLKATTILKLTKNSRIENLAVFIFF